MSEQTQKDDKSKRLGENLGDVVIQMITADQSTNKVIIPVKKAVIPGETIYYYFRKYDERENFPEGCLILNPQPNNDVSTTAAIPTELSPPYVVACPPTPPTLSDQPPVRSEPEIKTYVVGNNNSVRLKYKYLPKKGDRTPYE